MVTRTLKAVKAPKPKKMSKLASRTLDEKLMGSEPIFNGLVTDTGVNWGNWYNYMYDNKQAKVWLLEYLRSVNYDKAVISAIDNAPVWKTVPTSGWMARIMLRGGVFSEKSMENFNGWVHKNAIYDKKAVALDEDGLPIHAAVNVQTRIQNKNSNLLTEVETAYDAYLAGDEFSLYDFLKANEATAAAATFIRGFYRPQLNEVNENSVDVKTAFGKYRVRIKTFLQMIEDDANRFTSNTKTLKPRKPRTPKSIPVTKLVERVNFKKEDNELKIVSVAPVELVGAKQVWIYNTKYRKLMVYNAADKAELTVKGTTLLNYDTTTSQAKSLGKPSVVLQELLSATKISLRTFFIKLPRVASAVNGRLNEDCVILKVIK